MKGLEALEKLTNYGCSKTSEKIECKEIIEKELKALEIIKCLLFSKCKIYETTEKADSTTITKGDYYVIELKLNNERYFISKEEYELLKEVLE